MKRIYILLLGCITPLMMSALAPQNPAQTIIQDADSFTCSKTITLKPTPMSGYGAFYADYYEYHEFAGCVSFITGSKNHSSYNVEAEVGEHTYVVASAVEEINAPSRMPAKESSIPASALPTTTWWTSDPTRISQYDVYYVTIKYIIIEHNITLTANSSGTADYALTTTAGTASPYSGNIYCGLDGASKYTVLKGTTVNLNKALNSDYNSKFVYDASDVNYNLTLPAGNHTYCVYITNRARDNILWCDRYNITVKSPSINVNNHEIVRYAEAHSCDTVVTLSSTISGMASYDVYKVDEMGNETLIGNSDNYDVFPKVGEYWYKIVGTGSSTQIDNYHVIVKYHTEYREHTIPADLTTGLGDFQFYTNAGQYDPNVGTNFCGLEVQYKLIEGTTESTSGCTTINYDASLVNDKVSLPVGTHIYSIYMVSSDNVIWWCDRFTITVTSVSCTSGLVYTKWDDFLFVDNGDSNGYAPFVEYQWYKDGNPISGATKQWLRTTQTEGALPSGKYYVRITDNTGNVILTCPEAFDDLPKSQPLNPHSTTGAPARKQIKDGQLLIRYNDKWYNTMGEEIK